MFIIKYSEVIDVFFWPRVMLLISADIVFKFFGWFYRNVLLKYTGYVQCYFSSYSYTVNGI